MLSTIHEYAKANSMTLEQVQEHYRVEKELAKRLMESSREERKYLYTELYDELFKKIPYHPLLVRKQSPQEVENIISQTMNFLRKFITDTSTYLEVGPGDCSIAIEACSYVNKVYAVDVSNEITNNSEFPPNFELIISDGVSIPVPSETIDVIYSNQLMEHLHPDDAIDQLKNLYTVLKENGFYICSTPNRLSGPHDVSLGFSELANGFHLKEYLIAELYEVFKVVGFKKISFVKSYKNISIQIPLNPITVYFIKILEKVVSHLPFYLRRRIAKTLIIFRNMTLIGIK